MVKSATAVNPIMLLLLSNTIESIESATDDFCLFRISKTVQLTCDRKLSDIVLEARKAVRHIVVSMTEGAYVNKEFQVSGLELLLFRIFQKFLDQFQVSYYA